MRFSARVLPAAAILAGSFRALAWAQTPAPAPAVSPTPAAPASEAPAPASPAPAGAAVAVPAIAGPAPTPATALRIVDAPLLSIARLPAENPYGSSAPVPAALPAKLPFTDATMPTGLFVSVHVDPAGRSLSARRERDPIPSISAEVLKSLARWTFSPARKGAQTVDTWGAYRLELTAEIRAPKILQMAFTPITPSTPIPTPLAWPSDTDWLESRRPAPLSDGTVPIDQVDTAPIPQKTPWSADSYKGPFSVRFWVRVDKTGRIDRAIPLESSDPIWIPYFRKAMTAWALRPAQAEGAPIDSWSDLTLGGQISCSIDVKQIAALRRPLGP